jgi:hypothetical protein
MKTQYAKPAMLVLTGAHEIASVKSNGARDIVGAIIDGVCYAYAVTVRRFRARLGQDQGHKQGE